MLDLLYVHLLHPLASQVISYYQINYQLCPHERFLWPIDRNASDRAIPSSNIDLHCAHRSCNLEKCKVCGDIVPKKHAKEHFLNTHASVTCSLCSEAMEHEILAIHKGGILEPELCHLCNRYIRLRERYKHESRCNGIPEDNVCIHAIIYNWRDVRPPEREQCQLQ